MSEVNPHIFREYDIRGLVKEDFTDADVLLLGKGIGTFLKRSGSQSVVIGRDDRESSPRIRAVLAKGLAATGLHVVDIGRVPTPALYFAVQKLGLGGGVMISGSHNPPEFNGLKIAGSGLMPVYGQLIQDIRTLVEKNDFETGEGTVTEKEILGAYTEAITSHLTLKKKLRVVVDAANGMASLVMPKLFEALGATVECLYCDSDGTFPNHTADTILPAFYTALQKKVVETGADVGIGYDGDADRFGVVDEKGNVIAMDRIMVLLIQDVLENASDTSIVFDVRCSRALPEAITRYGGIPVLWKVGNSPIKAKMREIDASFGGELSGHIMYKDFFNIDDGVYASGRLLQILSHTDTTLSALDDEIPRYVSSEEVHIDVSDDIKFEIIEELTTAFKKEYDVVAIDGVRVEFGDGWGLVRASNTRPQMKLRFEAVNRKRLQEIMELFQEKLRAYPQLVFDAADFLSAIPV